MNFKEFFQKRQSLHEGIRDVLPPNPEHWNASHWAAHQIEGDLFNARDWIKLQIWNKPDSLPDIRSRADSIYGTWVRHFKGISQEVRDEKIVGAVRRIAGSWRLVMQAIPSIPAQHLDRDQLRKALINLTQTLEEGENAIHPSIGIKKDPHLAMTGGVNRLFGLPSSSEYRRT